ncbi:MAG TPA: menaquinone biosynthesis protein [Bacteroidales bacterium]|nr:menaquinone biosynthesis protein [Bacteroidales bacterium]HQN16408.1 menaquinone biosynthesis protein [Bacteroidales bacterium]HQP15231.1 menaquinone biosynthesis protein [Bacteroidales bacterium]
MHRTLTIAAVSYANTFPFVYGIENSRLIDNFQLQLFPPAGCAASFASGDADIALVPVGALPSLSGYRIISEYCIGAVKEVKTVLLLSNKKIKDIRSIGLDHESATSVKLVKIFARHHWHIQPAWQVMEVCNPEAYQQTDAVVAIGDKAISLSKKFLYQTDLAAEWRNFTGLPFVFAVWICRNDLPAAKENSFSAALQYGIDNISKVVEKYKTRLAADFDLEGYYQHNIDYHLDKEKKQSLQKFLTFVAETV